MVLDLKKEVYRTNANKTKINTAKNNINVVLRKFGETDAENLSSVPDKINLIASKMRGYARLELNKTVNSGAVSIPVNIAFEPKFFLVLFETDCSKVPVTGKAVFSLGGKTTDYFKEFLIQAESVRGKYIRDLSFKNKTLKFTLENNENNPIVVKSITLLN